MILPAQIIRMYCQSPAPLLTPFHERSVYPETGMSWGLSSAGYDVRVAQGHNIPPGGFVLASTLEYVNIPHGLMIFVKDKSSWARKGVAVQNTVLEPGWRGYTTLELTNHSDASIVIPALSPIAQFVFCKLAEATQQPYTGKYQNQGSFPQEPLFETTPS